MGQAALNPVDMSILDPSMGDDDQQSDPRRKLMQLMMSQMSTQPGGPEGLGSGGGDGSAAGSAGLLRMMPPSSSPDSGAADMESAVRSGDIKPPGFDDSTGLPLSYPATERMGEARGKLQRLNQPESGRHLLLRSIMQLAPILAAGLAGRGSGTGMSAAAGAAQGTANANEVAYQRKQTEIGRTQQQYQFEAGQEEKQRETAMREKLAISNMESQKAYRSLMSAIANRKVDVSAKLGEERNDTRLAAAGYVRDAQGRVRPMTPDDLSEIQKAKVDLDNASEEYKRAQMNNIPAQMEIKKRALDLSIQKLGVMMQNLQFSQDMRREAQDYRETGPTTQMRDRSQQAQVITQTSKGLIDQITKHGKALGPLMGRYGSLTDFLGNPPPEYADLASQITTYIALQPAAHGFRGMRAVQEFEKSIGSPIRTPEALIAAIQGNVRGLQPMAGMDTFTPLKRATPMGSGPAPARGKLKKGAAKSAGDQAGSADGMPPPGAKIRDYTQLGTGAH